MEYLNDIVSFEVAKTAKEKWFDERTCHAFWRNIENNYNLINDVYMSNSDLLDHNYTAPTQSELQRWLREKYGIHIVLIPTVTSNWTFKTITIMSERDNDIIIGIKNVSDLPPYKEVCGEDFNSYEEALENGLQMALDSIKI